MECESARRMIEAYLDDELLRADARAVEAHVDGCADCSAALARLHALRQDLRDPALQHPAPEELRARIRDAAAAAHSESAPPMRRMISRSTPSWWGIAASCLLAFAAGGLVVDRWNPNRETADAGAQVTRDLFASHWRALAATSPVDVVSSDHHTVKPWFAGRIAESPSVQDFASQGFALVGGRIDYVGTQRVAVLVYRHGQHLIDVYVLPQVAPGILAAHSVSQGYSANVVTLGTEQAVVVTDMDATETAKLAKLLSEIR